MQPVQSRLHCQFLCHALKALFFYQNSPKIKLFLQKKKNFQALGTPPPDPQTQPPIANFRQRAW